MNITLTHNSIVTCLLLQMAVVFSCASCKDHPTSITIYPDPIFSSSKWKNDSTGCLAYRGRTYESVAKNAAYFIGKDYNFLVEFLGKLSVPRLRKTSTPRLYYVVDCTAMPIPTTNLSSTSPTPRKIIYSPDYATTLVFDMRGDTCKNVRIAMP